MILIEFLLFLFLNNRNSNENALCTTDIMAYLRLDEYGKHAVESVIKAG